MSAPNPAASALIAHLGLQPLPHEGGYFARTWTSRETLPNGRPTGTAIYFLLTPDGFSALHRLDADELWHFHSGDPVEHLQLFLLSETLPTPSPSSASPANACVLPGSADVPVGSDARLTRLGPNLTSGEIPQLTVPSGVWQGARLAENSPHGWALLSCTMSPGWNDAGFELGSRTSLTTLFPAHRVTISRLTRTT